MISFNNLWLYARGSIDPYNPLGLHSNTICVSLTEV